jgi:hypothetical protein
LERTKLLRPDLLKNEWFKRVILSLRSCSESSFTSSKLRFFTLHDA